MIFIYSEPLVNRKLDKQKKEYFEPNGSQTLSTDIEYTRLIKSLASTKKEFKIYKSSINIDRFAKYLAQ